MATKKRKKSWLRAYLKSIFPPYSKKDLLPIVFTTFVLFGLFIMLKPVLAEIVGANNPTAPDLRGAYDNPLVVPYIHIEQNTTHFHWAPSVSNSPIVKYNIYTGDSWTTATSLSASTTNTNYVFYNTNGRTFYAFEAVDAEGKVSPRTLESTFVADDWCNCADDDDAVMSGFLSNTDGSPFTSAVAFEITIGKQRVRVPRTKWRPTTNPSMLGGYYVQVFPDAKSPGYYQITLTASGYNTVTKDVYLKPGYSVETQWQLTPVPTKGKR